MHWRARFLQNRSRMTPRQLPGSATFATVLQATRRRMAVVAMLAPLLGTLALPACGEAGPAGGPIEDLGLLEAKADQPALREVTLTLEGGATKWYRIGAPGFLARLSQAGQVEAQLTAK